MEPCLYRQGEFRTAVRQADGDMPQWSPAFIGRERATTAGIPRGVSRRNGALPLSAGRAWGALLAVADRHAAMEPCLYRQGEDFWLPGIQVWVEVPQWSPAFIGRERPPSGPGRRPGSPPQWSPAFIGRE